jgi:predicted metal-dependent peptidase
MLCRMNVIRDDAHTPTMSTDGKSIFWNDSYVAPLSDLQLVGLLAHEIMHVVRRHMLRRGQRDPKKWNYACDGAIDHDLKDSGFDVPDSFANQPSWNWAKGLTAESIYDQMPNEDSSPERSGGVEDAPAHGEVEMANMEIEIKIAIQQAATAQATSKKRTMPAWMKAIVEEIRAPKVPWQELLRTFVSNRVPCGLTWSRNNRKFIHNRTYLPGKLKEGLGELVIYVDTSGSVWNMKDQFYAELKSIVEDMDPEKVHIIQCDASPGAYFCCEPGDIVDPSFVGGGGSDFRPAFKKIEEMGINPVGAIVLSDMLIKFPTDAPHYPVLGISTTTTAGPTWMEMAWLQ